MSSKKLIYKYREEIICGSDGDLDRTNILTKSAGIQGEWPECFPKEMRTELTDKDSSVVSLERRKCNCGKHELFYDRISPDVWPEHWEQRIKIFEK